MRFRNALCEFSTYLLTYLLTHHQFSSVKEHSHRTKGPFTLCALSRVICQHPLRRCELFLRDFAVDRLFFQLFSAGAVVMGGRGPQPPSERSAPLAPDENFGECTEHLGWKFTDDMLVWCPKLHILVYDRQNFLGDHPLRRPLTSPLLTPKQQVQEPSWFSAVSRCTNYLQCMHNALTTWQIAEYRLCSHYLHDF